jgi:hypothetical protein
MTTPRTITEFEEAVAKLAAPLGLTLEATTWRHTPGRPTVVTIRLVTEADQLALFE